MSTDTDALSMGTTEQPRKMTRYVQNTIVVAVVAFIEIGVLLAVFPGPLLRSCYVDGFRREC